MFSWTMNSIALQGSFKFNQKINYKEIVQLINDSLVPVPINKLELLFLQPFLKERRQKVKFWFSYVHIHIYSFACSKFSVKRFKMT